MSDKLGYLPATALKSDPTTLTTDGDTTSVSNGLTRNREEPSIALMYADMLRVGRRDRDETMALLRATMTRAHFFVAAGDHLRSDMTPDGVEMFEMLRRPYELIARDVLGLDFTPESFPMEFFLADRLVESHTS